MVQTSKASDTQIAHKNRKKTLEQQNNVGYTPVHSYKGFILLKMDDEDPLEVRKFFWRLLTPDGEIEDYQASSYRVEPFRDFISKIDNRG